MSDADTHIEAIRKRIGRLFWVYVSALAVLLISVAGSLVLVELESDQLTQDARQINMSGRQRMLSQRIIYLASEHQTANAAERPQTAAALTEAIDTFERAISLFETSHSELTGLAADAPRIDRLYFGPGPEGQPSLDARVRAYIRHARAILADPTDRASLAALRSIEQGGLLRDLDQVVSAFEAESIARVSFLRQLEFLSLALAFSIVLVEILFVFRPGHRLLRRSFARLTQQNNALTAAHARSEELNSQLRERAEELETERAALDTALKDSEHLREEQAAFTYAVSHDLKSPTNTIQLLLNEISLMLPQDGEQELHELIGHATAANQRMHLLIKDTLEYSWATHHRAEPEHFALSQVMEEVFADLRAEIEDSGAEIQHGALPWLQGYRMQIRILLQNLIGNALKYRHPDVPPRLSVACDWDEDGQEYLLRVTDNGIGIAPEDQQRIFGLFQRLHLQSEFSGSGLGLATCQRIAFNHGGDISVTSTPGEGSTFHVSLKPVLPEAPRDRAALQEETLAA